MLVDGWVELAARMLVVGLAAARLWRLAARDDLTGWWRDRMAATRVGASVVDFLDCRWCAGFWVAVVVYTAVVYVPVVVPFVAVFAAAQVAALTSGDSGHDRDDVGVGG